MLLYSKENSPGANLDVLAGIDYPGRLLVVGKTAGGLATQVYAVGGRSDGSKNRILVKDDNIVSTEAFDKTKSVGDPKLTIYDAMRRVGTQHIISNGDQTGTAIQYARCGLSFKKAMQRRQFEPDKPNYTPRITGFSDIQPAEGQPSFGLSLTRRNPLTGGPLRSFYMEGDDGLALEPGTGLCLHTYRRNGNPLPSFDEAPFVIPVEESAADTAQMLWERLNPDTRVAIAAKTIDASGQVEFDIINLHQ